MFIPVTIPLLCLAPDGTSRFATRASIVSVGCEPEVECSVTACPEKGFCSKAIGVLTALVCMAALSEPALCVGGTEPTSNAAAVSYFRCDRGVVDSLGVALPDDFARPDALAWKVSMDPGQSTPIICNGQVFLTTYRKQSQQLATVALDAGSGTTRWRNELPASRIETFHPQMGSAAVATPACDGSRVFVFFGSRGLVCYDLGGKLLWELPLGPFQDEYGAGSSPVIIDDKVVLCQDHDTESFLIAVNRLTGKVVWKVARPDAVRSYSTPVIWARNGHSELLIAGALELAGYDPANGEKLWWGRGLARIVIPAPAPSGDRVYMASWAPGGDQGRRVSLDAWPVALGKWDHDKNNRLTRAEIEDQEVLDRFARMDLDQSNDLDQKEWERHAAIFRQAQNAVLAFRPSGKGELKPGDLLWKHQRGIPYVASPLLDKGILWMVKDGGIVTKLEAEGGQLLQEERLPGPGNYYASPVAGDGKVYFASEQGVVSVLADEREWKLISTHNLREKIYATPTIHRGKIYLRTDQTLYCFKGT